MQYASCGSIKSIVEIYDPLKENNIKKYLIQILSKLNYMHSLNIIHWDLKCSNLLLDWHSGEVKLSYFGNAVHKEGKRGKM